MKVVIEVPDGLRVLVSDTILRASDLEHQRGDHKLADALSDVGKAIKRAS